MNSFCINCGTALPKEASFCPKCGAKIEIPCCLACGREVDFEADFCIYCGHPLTEREEGVSTPAKSPELNPPSETLDTSSEPVQPTPKISPVPAQSTREVSRSDDVQEFSWSYFKLGFTNFSNCGHNLTARLTREKLHITEQKNRGWKSTTENTDVALIDIVELCIKARVSVLYWILYSVLATACVFAAFIGVLDVTTCVILALLIGVSIWVSSFNLLHNELVILTRDNRKIVLKGAKETVFQQLEQGISSRTGVRIGEPPSAALTIIRSISIGVAATVTVFLLLGGEATPPAAPTEDPPLTNDELIGRWDLQYMESDGVVYSFSSFLDQGYTANETAAFFHSIYIQFFEDGSFEQVATHEDGTPEQTYGTWTIRDNHIAMTSASTTIEGYLHNGLFCMESEDLTARFEHVSTVPTRTTDSFDEPNYRPNYEPSETTQPSIAPSATSPTVPDALYKVMSEKTLFPVREGYYNEYSEATEFDDSSEIDVMSCDSIFIYYGDPEPVRYDTLSFAVVDMDGDGKSEVVLCGDCGFDGLYTVLHEHEGTVHGYTVHFRGMSPLLSNGLFGGSNGAADFSISKFEFYGSDASIKEVARELSWDEYTYYVFKSEVSKEEYDNYLARIGWDWNNEAVFYDFTDENIQLLLAP